MSANEMHLNMEVGQETPFPPTAQPLEQWAGARHNGKAWPIVSAMPNELVLEISPDTVKQIKVG